jgi:F0F1-type ATP synthase membrane subunit b/b'
MSSTNSAAGLPVPETEALLHRVAGIIAGARALPLSSSVKLDNKDEVLELLREASERLPDELRQARWMLKEREEYLAATKRQAEELVEAARSEAQRLVQRTEILKEAQAQARRVVQEARDEARRLRLEAEDYADQKLAHFEIVLERTLKTVASGRQKLSGMPDKDQDGEGAGAPQGNAPGAGPGGPTGVAGFEPMAPEGARAAGSGADRGRRPSGRNGSRPLGGTVSPAVVLTGAGPGLIDPTGPVGGFGGPAPRAAGSRGATTPGPRAGGRSAQPGDGPGLRGAGLGGTGLSGAGLGKPDQSDWADEGFFDQDLQG